MSCPQTGAVPFELKGVHVLISGGKTDLQHAQQDTKSDHIHVFSSNENDALSVDNRKRKCTTEIKKKSVDCST